MKVLIVGGGGREHAIAWKLSQSPRVQKLYCAPGNGGIAQIARCLPCAATDLEAIVDFSLKEKIDLVVVAPDDPLAMGLVDLLEEKGVRAFGPSASAARIEASKVFSKELMKKYGIPTAAYRVFDDPDEACAYIDETGAPIVVKADGLALGKGVVVAQTAREAKAAVRAIMIDGVFGASGKRVVVEEYMTGPEVSVLAFTDGKTVKPMVSSQDHKRAFDGDIGPNTGGMGAFSPSRHYTDEMHRVAMEFIIRPTIEAMEKEGCPFKGVLYFGLMLTKNGPKTLEYNARFGDPETQVVLPRLKTDLLDIFEAVIDGRLSEQPIEWDERAAACVVLASGGYPGKYEKGKRISGVERAEETGALVFHAGTRREGEELVTSGGRVLGVAALGGELREAVSGAYRAADLIAFDGAFCRRDIGSK